MRNEYRNHKTNSHIFEGLPDSLPYENATNTLEQPSLKIRSLDLIDSVYNPD